MRWRKTCFGLVLVAAIGAAALRLPRPAERPMHTDEAVHAIKFRLLLEKGEYTYNPEQYHGPTLNYLTLIPAWLSGAKELTNVSELTLRIVPVFFGVLLILLLLLLADGLGKTTIVIAAVFTAVSPAFVFYSRYYIQEMLLVCFTFGVIGSGWRYTQSRNIGWAVLTGIFLGLMHATKETCVIAFGSMLAAVWLAGLMRRRAGESSKLIGTIKTIKPWHFGAVIAAAVIISALFFSSFFTNPGGIVDSVRSHSAYVTRASHSPLHIHPWYYYLKMLVYSRCAWGPIWSEAFIVVLAAVGFVVAMVRRPRGGVNIHLLAFIAFYTAVMTILYCVIRYKTPWCVLGFLHGMILLAAIGGAALINSAPSVLSRVIISLLLLAGGVHLTWQSYLGNYKYYADTSNPYVYAHTSKDIFSVVKRIDEVARAGPEGHNTYIQVICPDDDYWPLPWYLRSFSRVAYQSEVDNSLAAAPVIIAAPSAEPALRKFLDLAPPGEKNLYVPLFDSYMELRPQVELLGFVTKDLWDRYRQREAQSAVSQTDAKR